MMSSSSYEKFADLRIPLEDIESATNNFSNENLIRRGGFGQVYKGKLLRSGQLIDIVARRLDKTYRQGNKEFLMEVSVLSTLKHDNLVSMVGFCDEKGEKIIINQHVTNGSLDNYLEDITELTWIRRLEICFGVASALKYIHYDEGRDLSVIHRNIKSSKILLDADWKPKLSGFELSMTHTAARRHRLLVDRLSGTIGYIDPKYEKTGGVTHKSDVYSFGVVLFEVLCGRRAFANHEWVSAQLAKEDSIEHLTDEVEKLDDEGQSPQHSTEEMRDSAGPSSSTNLSAAKMQLPSGNLTGETPSNNSEQMQRPPSRNFSAPQTSSEIIIRGASSSDIAHERSSNNNSEQTRPIWTTNFSVASHTTSLVNLADGRPSIDSEQMQQQRPPSTNVSGYGNLADGRPFKNNSEQMQRPPSRNPSGYGPTITSPIISSRNFSAPQTSSEVIIRGASSSDIAHERPSNNNSEQTRPLSTRNFSVASHTSPINLPDARPSNNSEQMPPELPSPPSLNFSGYGNFEGVRAPNFSDVRLPSFTNLSGYLRPIQNSGTNIRPISYRNFSEQRNMGNSFSELGVITRVVSCGNMAHERPSNNLSDEMWPQSTRNFSVASRTTSFANLAYERPSFKDSKREQPPSTTKLTGPPSDRDLRRPVSTGSLIAGDQEEEPTVPMEQRPALNPVEMCMFTLAPSARLHYEERLGHLCIPEEELLAPLAISHYDDGKLYDLIHPDLRKQMDQLSFEVFSKTAYRCLRDQRSQRPDIDEIVIELQKSLNHQRKHENLNEHSEDATEVEGTSTNKWLNLGHLKIGFHDIEFATESFSETHYLGEGSFGKVYKAELEHFDSKNSSNIEGDNVYDLPKIRSIVAIKSLLKKEGTQAEEGFDAEIKTLTSCKHPNIVSLLGFCNEEGSDLILVYEYVSNGSLSNLLISVDKMTNFKWEQRLQMCLDIAEGLNYLHSQHSIIHRDIKSDNILLDHNWVAKIADFGLSKMGPKPQEISYHKTRVAGTDMYLDPEYEKTERLKEASDIYSMGVVFFEIMSGTLAYDTRYTNENDKGLAPFVRKLFHKGTLKDILDRKIQEECDENVFSLSTGPNQDSLDAFLDIAYPCLAETQTKRPGIGVVIDQLKKALQLQKSYKDKLQISFEDIKLATDKFSDKNRIGRGGFGRVYKGEVTNDNGRQTTIAAKRLDKAGDQGETEFLTELEILLEYKHENVIGLVGYCNQQGEKIIVYEHASKGSLDSHLSNKDLTWRKRLQICIDIASGLDFLHRGGVTQEVVMHRDIKSPNILLDDDWKAKLSDFGLSLITPINKDIDFVVDNACGTKGYCDPLYLKLGLFTKASDIYSFGVLLFEILCGRLMFEDIKGRIIPLIDTFKGHYEKGNLDEVVFKDMKEQIGQKSLTTFQKLANECVHDLRIKRPTTSDVLSRLKQALVFQDDYEIWEPKLPKDYKEIFKMSNFSENDLPETKKELHNILSKGILLQKGKMLFTLGDNGERNEMISAIKLLYKHHRSYKWQSVPESRFHKVAEVLDIANLKIQVNIKPHFLSPGVSYGVHLVFRFSGPRKSSANRMYVNLKYKKGSETFHAYFATWREDGWMTIELFQFLNDNASFKILLESFSGCYCGSDSVFFEGIEFRAIHKVSPEESKNDLKEVQQVLNSNVNIDHLQQLPIVTEKLVWIFEKNEESEKFLSREKENKKKPYMFLAREALYESSLVKPSNSKPSANSRFQDVIELPRIQVFGIKCKIESQRLSPNTKYMCYLVFKLSKKCRGLHCPVVIRDLLHRKNKETGIIYFRYPRSCNRDDTHRVPKEREDGLMEVNVWQFNSNNEVRADYVSMSLKLTSYEGTMYGLILSELEFRTM